MIPEKLTCYNSNCLSAVILNYFQHNLNFKETNNGKTNQKRRY